MDQQSNGPNDQERLTGSDEAMDSKFITSDHTEEQKVSGRRNVVLVVAALRLNQTVWARRYVGGRSNGNAVAGLGFPCCGYSADCSRLSTGQLNDGAINVEGRIGL